MVIVSGPAADEAAPPGASGPALARWRERADVEPDWRRRVLQAAGAPLALAAHCAGAVARARGLDDESAWFATPVHLVAGVDRAFLAPRGLLRLDEREWLALCAGFARHFGGDGLRLEPLTSDTALLQGATLGELCTYEPAQCLGADVRDRLPSGPGAARWRALTGELELWLHAEAWNRERERRGVPRVTAMWLWGGRKPGATGDDGRGATTAARPHASWWLVGADPWLGALPALYAGFAVQWADGYDALRRAGSPPMGAAVLWRSELGLAELESRWLQPARRALGRGELATLSLHHGSRCWQLDRSARWRWWWPRRSIAQLAAVTHG